MNYWTKKRYASVSLLMGLISGAHAGYVGGNPLTATDPTGLLQFNKPPPSTIPPEGETFDALVCLETCLKGTTGNLDLNLQVKVEITGRSLQASFEAHQCVERLPLGRYCRWGRLVELEQPCGISSC